MNAQYIFVIFILLAAVSYAGAVFWKKTKAFSPKSGCGSDCGCGTKERKHS